MTVAVPQFSNFKNRKFAIIGDLQKTSLLETLFLRRENGALAQKALIDHLARENIDFVILLGDLVFNGANKDNWAYFHNIVEPLVRKNIKLIMVMGNHDYGFGTRRGLIQVTSLFPMGPNGQTWQSFVVGTLGFILLDSNMSHLTSMQRHEQIYWLIKTLNSFEAAENISSVSIFSHHPLFLINNFASKDLSTLWTIIRRYKKTKAAFAGHIHSYEKINYGEIVGIICGGGGGPRVQNKWITLFNGIKIKLTLKPFHYIIGELTQDACQFKVKSLNSQTLTMEKLDSFKI